MKRVLTANEAEAEYVSTLDSLSQTAIFQYTFTAVMVYLAYLADASKPAAFFGFELTKIQWVFVALTSSSVTNFYVARRVTNLTTLLKMHPHQRRKLKFLTWHHKWLLNPFREKWIRWSRKQLKTTRFPMLRIGRFELYPLNYYLVIQTYFLIYSVTILFGWYGEYGEQLSLFSKLLGGITVTALYSIAGVWANVSLDRAISRHIWALWGYTYPWAKHKTY
jgi:hypothetical protein